MWCGGGGWDVGDLGMFQGTLSYRIEKHDMCVDADEECAESVDVLNSVFVLRKPLSSPIVVRVKLNGKDAVMKLDTGTAGSIIPE